MKKFYAEVYFFKDGVSNKEVQDSPNLDLYRTETRLENVASTDWDAAKKIISIRQGNIAYIHLIESKSLDYTD